MAAQVKTYKPADISLVLAQGYQVGGIVSLGMTFPKERFKIINGIKGQNVRVRNQDTSCILTVELLQTSTANDVLSDILSQDKVTGRGRLQVLISDISGTTKIQSLNGYVSNFPETTYTNNLATRTWQIVLLNTELIKIGGNSTNRPAFLEQAASFISGAVDTVTDFAQGIF